jgi:dephospho-CoA kinase
MWQRGVRRVALTGGIATGKSHVRARIEAAGVPTIDADVLAREAVAPGSPVLYAIVERFGASVLQPDGSLDRRALGAQVFSDPAARRDLEAIVHPFVRQRTEQWFAALDSTVHSFAVADIPLLYETGRDADFDAVIATACEPAAQLQRVMARDGLTREEAQARIAAQLPIDEKVRRADYVITTDGSFEDTDRQVEQLLAMLAERGDGQPNRSPR